MTNSLNKVLVCYSLWGDNPKYKIGYHENIKLAKENGFDMMTEPVGIYGLSGYFWRFLLCRLNYDFFIFRDLDSRLTERDIASVKEWIESGKTLHVQRDHPHHDWSMMGGMWGIKKIKNFDIVKLIYDWISKNPYPEYFGRKDKPDGWMTDMFFLRDVIFPMFKDDCLQHDELFGDKYGETKPFPTKRVGLEYVGETIEADGSVSEEHRQILKDYLDGHK